MKYLGIIFLSGLLIGCQTTNDWTSLFDGNSFDGWHVYGAGQDFDGWYVDQGVLVLDPARRTKARNSNLITNEKYKDFELSIDWMISENGNSGIFWGVLEDTGRFEHPYQTGPEIQILDDNYQEYIDQRGDINRAGSLYNLLPPSKIVAKTANEWNHMILHIDQTNNSGFVKLNGELILEFPVNGPEWKALISASGFSGWDGFGQMEEGHICLQDHGSQVAFRDIRIRKLNQ